MKRFEDNRREIHIMAESVILSAAKDLARRMEKSFAALRMTGIISKCLS
jgi:hypothetical protein